MVPFDNRNNNNNNNRSQVTSMLGPNADNKLCCYKWIFIVICAIAISAGIIFITLAVPDIAFKFQNNQVSFKLKIIENANFIIYLASSRYIESDPSDTCHCITISGHL